MKTRRQRKGGTRRVGGIFNAARAAIGNLKNGGGRVLQWNQIINAMSDEGFRMLKGMTVMMGGEDPNDKKYKNLNVLPTAAYMNGVATNRGSATAQITAAAETPDTPGTQPDAEEPGAQGAEEPGAQGAEEPGAQGAEEPGEQSEPEPGEQSEPKAPPKEGGTRKNKRNRI